MRSTAGGNRVKAYRRRRQLFQDRVWTQNRVKAELRFYGIELLEPLGPWIRR